MARTPPGSPTVRPSHWRDIKTQLGSSLAHGNCTAITLLQRTKAETLVGTFIT